MAKLVSLISAARILGVKYETAQRWLSEYIVSGVVDGRRQRAIPIDSLRDVLREKSGDEIASLEAEDALARLDELALEVSKQREQIVSIADLLKKIAKKVNGHNV